MKFQYLFVILIFVINSIISQSDNGFESIYLTEGDFSRNSRTLISKVSEGDHLLTDLYGPGNVDVRKVSLNGELIYSLDFHSVLDTARYFTTSDKIQCLGSNCIKAVSYKHDVFVYDTLVNYILMFNSSSGEIINSKLVDIGSSEIRLRKLMWVDENNIIGLYAEPNFSNVTPIIVRFDYNLNVVDTLRISGNYRDNFERIRESNWEIGVIDQNYLKLRIGDKSDDSLNIFSLNLNPFEISLQEVIYFPDHQFYNGKIHTNDELNYFQIIEDPREEIFPNYPSMNCYSDNGEEIWKSELGLSLSGFISSQIVDSKVVGSLIYAYSRINFEDQCINVLSCVNRYSGQVIWENFNSNTSNRLIQSGNIFVAENDIYLLFTERVPEGNSLILKYTIDGEFIERDTTSIGTGQSYEVEYDELIKIDDYIYIGGVKDFEYFEIIKSEVESITTVDENIDFLIFPNPVADEIVLPGALEGGNYQIFTSEFRLSLSGKLIGNKINVQDLAPSGIYFLLIEYVESLNSKKIVTKRFIKK